MGYRTDSYAYVATCRRACEDATGSPKPYLVGGVGGIINIAELPISHSAFASVLTAILNEPERDGRVNAGFSISGDHVTMRANERILLIDDSDSFQQLTAAVLVRRRYDVRCAANGQIGLELAASGAPDLILLDLHMPGLDGIDVLSTLRQCASTSAIPVLMLTGSASEEHVRMALALGANGYVLKPFNVRDLLGRIQAVLHPQR